MMNRGSPKPKCPPPDQCGYKTPSCQWRATSIQFGRWNSASWPETLPSRMIGRMAHVARAAAKTTASRHAAALGGDGSSMGGRGSIGWTEEDNRSGAFWANGPLRGREGNTEKKKQGQFVAFLRNGLRLGEICRGAQAEACAASSH